MRALPVRACYSRPTPNTLGTDLARGAAHRGCWRRLLPQKHLLPHLPLGPRLRSQLGQVIGSKAREAGVARLATGAGSEALIWLWG